LEVDVLFITYMEWKRYLTCQRKVIDHGRNWWCES